MSSEKETGNEEGILVVLFLILGCLVGAIFRVISKKLSLPFTPMILIFGLVLGIFKNSFGEVGESATIVEGMSPHLLLFVFIPPLIFESAFPGVLWSSVLIALAFKSILFYSDNDLSFVEALTLGCILSPTDAIATVSLLKEIGAGARFNTLLEGESLLNDGSSIFLFLVFLKILHGEDTTTVGIALDFVKTSFGGPLLGLIFGILMGFILKKITQDKILITTITIIGVYLCFFVSEFTILKVSGILSTVTLGIYMSAVGKRKMSIQSEECLHNVWSVLQYIFEVLIFFVSGVVVGVEIIHGSTILPSDWVKMLVFWILIIAIRGIMILTFYPILKRASYGITMKEIIVLSYGGTRGAICLCLSLLINYDVGLRIRFRELAVFYSCGITVLTVMINGSTCKKLIEFVGLFKPSQVKKKLLERCVKEVLASTNEKFKELKKEPSVAYAEWKTVEKLARCHQLGETKNNEIERITLQEGLRPIESKKMIEEIRFRITGYMNKVFWRMYKHGELSESSITLLSSVTDIVHDMINEKLHYFELLSSNFTMSTMHFCFKLKDTPIIGRYCMSLMVNNLYEAYETTNAFIEACEDMNNSFESEFPQSRELTTVLEEIKENMEQAIMYITELDNTYSSVSRSVHTIKASVTLLKHKKKKLEEIYEQGFIDELEYEELIKEVQENIVEVQESSFDTSGIRFNEVLADCPLFSSLPLHEVINLRQESVEKHYHKNDIILEVGAKMRNVLFVITGSAKEKFDDFYFMKGLGSVLNPYDFFYKEPSKAKAFALNHATVMEINGEIIYELFEAYPAFKNEWMKSVFLYCLKHTELPDVENYLNDLSERDKRRLIERSTVIQLEKDKTLICDYGCYILDGEVQDEHEVTYERDSFIFDDVDLVVNKKSTILLFPEVDWKKHRSERNLLIDSLNDC